MLMKESIGGEQLLLDLITIIVESVLSDTYKKINEKYNVLLKERYEKYSVLSQIMHKGKSKEYN